MAKPTKDVAVYTTNYCPYCKLAKDLLRSKGIEYREVDVTNDDDQREKLIEMAGGRTTVPQIFVDGKSMGGYDDLVTFLKMEARFEAR